MKPSAQIGVAVLIGFIVLTLFMPTVLLNVDVNDTEVGSQSGIDYLTEGCFTASGANDTDNNEIDLTLSTANCLIEREAVFHLSGDVATGSVPVLIKLRRSVTYQDMTCNLATAGAGSTINVNAQENGIDIFSDANRVSLAPASTTADSGSPDDTSGISGDVLSIIIDDEDSGATASDLTCQLRVRHGLD